MIPKHIKLLFCIPFIIIIAYTVYLFTRYGSIPDIIPIHGYGGKNDGFGSKLFLFAPVVLNLIILAFIWLIIRRPEKIKFTFETKEEDEAKNLLSVSIGFSHSCHICDHGYESVIFFGCCL